MLEHISDRDVITTNTFQITTYRKKQTLTNKTIVHIVQSTIEHININI